MIAFNTDQPTQLLAAIKAAIQNKHVTTWAEINGYFTHTPQQWYRKAFLQPSISGNQLRFAIVAPQNQTTSSEVYAVYHGRFIEMMLYHFDKKFSNANATAMPTALDKVA